MALPLLHPIIIVPPPLQLVQFPPGTYRVSFNLITHSIEDAPLNVFLETIYARIQQCLQQVLHYHHTQKSVYQHPNTDPGSVWTDMYNLQSIDPLGIIFAVLSRMQMFYIPFPADMIATNNICLGVPGHPNHGFW
ncbi:hypothetical protein AcW1_010277 [Taiwanofungus camphoratus]|nr:hypothetical protein AcW1_010277 [Antrodia cinnamomea]